MEGVTRYRALLGAGSGSALQRLERTKVLPLELTV